MDGILFIRIEDRSTVTRNWKSIENILKNEIKSMLSWKKSYSQARYFG